MDDGVSKDWSAALAARRRYLGLRQRDLAELAEVSERFVHALEGGKQTAQLDKVVAVLRVLGLHLELRPGAADGIVAPDATDGR